MGKVMIFKDMKCKYCLGLCRKNGRQCNGTQKYQCVSCKKYQQLGYKYGAYDSTMNESIIKHVKRGNGIRDIAYLLNISPTTVIKRIRQIGSSLTSTYESEKELYTKWMSCAHLPAIKETSNGWFMQSIKEQEK